METLISVQLQVPGETVTKGLTLKTKYDTSHGYILNFAAFDLRMKS